MASKLVTFVSFVVTTVHVINGSHFFITQSESNAFLSRNNFDASDTECSLLDTVGTLQHQPDPSALYLPRWASHKKPKGFIRLSLYRTRRTCNNEKKRTDKDPCHGNGECQCDRPFTCKCNASFDGSTNCATCVSGFTGENCDQDVNECDSSNDLDACSDDATCTNTEGSYSCKCNDGFSDPVGDGINCYDIHECDRGTDTCSTNADCTNTQGSYNCTCKEGYEGDGHTCTDINECESGETNTCSSDANCTNTDGGYTCTCKSGYEGDGYTCSNIDDCVSNPCQHGICIDEVNDYTCNCVEGYSGKNCETDIDDCVSNPCQHGTCVDEVNDYTCNCVEGYSGRNCETDIDECESTPCVYGQCDDRVNDYFCDCDSGYEGKNCDEDIDDCVSNPCQHGICIDEVNDYTCNCVEGYSGKNCETDIDDCVSNPCQHGTCVDEVNDYTCNCVEGYSGRNCETDIDECESTPCVYGQCDDRVNDYFCDCDSGYEGKNCDEDIDECNSSPCMNGATCSDHVNGYSCTCMEDYTGTHCETDMCYAHLGADIAVILDSSISQTEENFQRQKEFTKSLVNAFPIGKEDFRFSALSVSDEASIHFDLDSHLIKENLLEAIDGIGRLNRTTNLHTTIKSVRDNIFTEISINRTKYLIILEDGLFSNPSETESEVIETKQAGVTLISVGFGNQILQKALIDAATDYKHVFSPITDDLKNWLLKRHVMDACPDCASHSSDVFILLETSNDLSRYVFHGLVKSFKSFVKILPVSQDRVHVSVATFDSTVSEKFDFVTHHSHSSIIASVMATRTDLTANYVTALQHITDNVFETPNGYRQGARKIAVLFISDTITDLDTVKEKADALKADNVTIAIITCTSQAKPKISDLQEIVSDPAYLFVIGETVYGGESAFDALTTLFEYTLCVFD